MLKLLFCVVFEQDIAAARLANDKEVNNKAINAGSSVSASSNNIKGRFLGCVPRERTAEV